MANEWKRGLFERAVAQIAHRPDMGYTTPEEAMLCGLACVLEKLEEMSKPRCPSPSGTCHPMAYALPDGESLVFCSYCGKLMPDTEAL